MAKRRTPQEIVLGLKQQIRQIEAQAREREKIADAAKQRRLADLIRTAGLYDEPEDVILGLLMKAQSTLQDPERGDALRSEARGIAAFGDPATLDGMIQRALQPVLNPAQREAKQGGTPEGFEAKPQRPPAGSLVAVAPSGTVSTEEAAQITTRTGVWLRNAARDGKLYAVRVPGRGRAGYAWRFDRRDLAAL